MRNQTQPFSNVQLELLKIFSVGISDEELVDLKELLVEFYSKRLISLANTAWDKNNWSNEKMDDILNSDEQ